MSAGRPPLLVRAYLASRRATGRLRSVSDAVQAGLWLGVMDRPALHALDDAFYAASAGYGSDRHNLRGLFGWEEEAVGACFGGCRSLLVVGAGGGREVLALARRGFRVEGFECNPALVGHAGGLLGREGCGAGVRLLPRDAVPEEGRFDGAVVGWSAYMLIAGRERRIRFLRELGERLPTGGPVLLSFWTRGRGSPRARIVLGIGGRLRRLLGREPLEAGDDLAPNFVHRFTEAEVAGELADAGFRMARFEPEGPGPHDSGWAVGTKD